MRLAMVSYFDIGVSYSIGDEVFTRIPPATNPAILQIGIHNPLGNGIAYNLLTVDPQLVASWREISKDMVNRKEMELGWTEQLNISEPDFKSQLIQIIDQQPIARCELTILAVGTVLLWLEFAPGIPLNYLGGVSKCLEFAAYQEQISTALWQVALSHTHQAIGAEANKLTKLSKRPDPAEEKDAEGYTELRLLTSFTDLILCIDPEDQPHIPDILNTAQIEDTEQNCIDFEYHGKLYFGWASCVIVPRDIADKDETPEQQIARILECIKIAHSFLGTCEAFEKLFRNEIFSQVSNYVQATGRVRSSRDLNRLRTLALAIVSLTDFTRVAPSAEDQKYFSFFEQYAQINQLQQTILNRCDVLFNVQQAETESEEKDREKRLQNILFLLTGITFVSVLSDSYNFVRQGEQHLIPQILMRLEVLLSIVILIILILLLLENSDSWLPKLRTWFSKFQKSNTRTQRRLRM
jgi:hypothetical protein